MASATLVSDHPIDLMHLDTPSVIGSWLVETPDGLALHDCGPASTLPGLERSLAAHGVGLGDLRHLLLSHIHLDHAGAAGQLAAANPKLTVHVSALGAGHLARPERLERSARRVFGEAYDALWGGMQPVPARQLSELPDDGQVLGMRVLAAPGHATHHVIYQLPDGTVLCGDAVGVRIIPEQGIYPVAPPPDCDFPTWHRTLDMLRGLEPQRLALTHFGLLDAGIGDHLDRLDAAIDRWVARARDADGVEEFTAAAHEELVADGAGDAIAAYDQTAPPWMSWHGMRHWHERIAAG